MSFNDYETSISAGQSARLYQFDRSATVVWRYTSANRNLLVNFQTFLRSPIEHDALEQGGEIGHRVGCAQAALRTSSRQRRTGAGARGNARLSPWPWRFPAPLCA